MATGYEIELYHNIGRIARALERIAEAMPLPQGCTGMRATGGAVVHKSTGTCPVHADQRP